MDRNLEEKLKEVNNLFSMTLTQCVCLLSDKLRFKRNVKVAFSTNKALSV